MNKCRTINVLKVFLAGFILLGTVVNAQVLYYNFNDSGNTSSNSGTGGSGYNLSLLDSSGNAIDLHSTGGYNLYGSAGHSLDLSAATQMGGTSATPGAGPVAYSSTAGKVFGGLTSFTVSGWYQGSSSPGSGARIFQAGNIFLYCNGSYLSFQYGTTDTVNSNATVTGIVTATSGTAITSFGSTSPTFFAITYTYDTAAGSKTVTFYYGDNNDASTLQSYSVTYTPTSTTYAAGSLGSLYVGGNSSGSGNTRPFDGYIDDFSVYSSILDSDTLNTLRVNQLLGIPEPTTYFMLLLGILVFWGLNRFRKMSAFRFN